MRVLVACECSNTVRDAFLKRGHDAYSCDLQRAAFPNPNWRRHIRGDVRPLLRERWDLVIAHPPCTYLSVISHCLLQRDKPLDDQPRRSGIIDGAIFFLDCMQTNADKICIENPIPNKFARELIPIKCTQVIQPWQFGHPFTKATHLWLKGLPPLQPTKVVTPTISWIDSGKKVGARGIHRDPNLRSKTFQGIADAMADQWGGL